MESVFASETTQGVDSKLRVAILFFILCPPLSAATLPEHLSFSAALHPAIQEKFIPLIQSTYKELGISTEILNLTVSRGLETANQGLVDGDVVRLESVIADYTNLIPVPVPLHEVDITLYCKQDVACSKTVLSNPDNHIAVIYGKGIAKRLNNEHEAQFFNYDMIPKLHEMMERDRMSYFIFMSPANEALGDVSNLNSVVVGKDRAYHLLHKKHASIIDSVAEQLRKHIN